MTEHPYSVEDRLTRLESLWLYDHDRRGEPGFLVDFRLSPETRKESRAAIDLATEQIRRELMAPYLVPGLLRLFTG